MFLVELARDRVDADRAEFAVAVRSAVWADSKKFKSYLKGLDSDG